MPRLQITNQKMLRTTSTISFLCATWLIASGCADSEGYAPIYKTQKQQGHTAVAGDGTVYTSAPSATFFRTDKGRLVEYTGLIEIECKNVETYCMQVNELICKYQGTSSKIDIATTTQLLKTLAYKADSNINVQRVQQHGTFIFKLPKKYAPTILPELLRLDAKIISMHLTGEDRTKEHRVAQIIDDATPASQGEPGSGSLQSSAMNKAQKEELEYRCKFLWCEANITGEAVIEHVAVPHTDGIRAQFSDEFRSSLRFGLAGLRSAALALSSIWPFTVLAILLLWNRKRIKAYIGMTKVGATK
jgi:hypothetical protein